MPSSLKLRIGARADEDISDIASVTEERWETAQSDDYIVTMREAFSTLCLFPSIGHRRTDLPRALRVWPVGRHLILYDVTDTELQIVRVVHNHQDLSGVELN